MMGLIGRKVGMTQIFDEKGEAIPVTVIEAGPCTVSEVRSAERNGYQAIQLGFGTNLESRFSRPVLGQFKKRNLPPARHLREFRVADLAGVEPGQTLTVAMFEKGTHVDVRGVTKGRGFAGVVKRHKFVAGHASHGPTAGKQPGSIGSSAYPSRVLKGKRLPGRMGGVNLRIKNLEVIGVNPEQNVLLVRGAVPGPTNGIVFVEKREA
ncbi:MAG: 50S ribosomal protein L3 [Candidatus Eisenbacteria bacterium]|uniref:Large ribosomal subunit protein uL3 n=1 Tax=Eiseniibacteriota bacterium TaxID=2212470 RepID=A0A538T8P9_UNCEI|nr:MAG: 50S ribosomal protein L3 [Candidatus Eisenbacteria bacterium]